MPKRSRALGAPMKITQKQVIQSYGHWTIDLLNFPHQEDLLTHLVRKMSTSPHGTMDHMSKWAKEYVDLEWEAYFMTFMFRHIPGSDQEKIRERAKASLVSTESSRAGWSEIQSHPSLLIFCRKPCFFRTCPAISGKSRPCVT
jgi:hypothetical protein